MSYKVTIHYFGYYFDNCTKTHKFVDLKITKQQI